MPHLSKCALWSPGLADMECTFEVETSLWWTWRAWWSMTMWRQRVLSVLVKGETDRYDRSRRHLLGWLCGRMAVSWWATRHVCTRSEKQMYLTSKKWGLTMRSGQERELSGRRSSVWWRGSKRPLLGMEESICRWGWTHEVPLVLARNLRCSQTKTEPAICIYSSGIVLFTLQLLLINKSGAGSSWLSVQAVCSGIRPT